MLNRFSRRIIDCRPEMQPHTPRCGRFRISDGLAQCGWQAIPAPDDAQPDALVNAVSRLDKKVFVEQPQNRIDLGRWALPIRGGKREEREGVNAHAWSRRNDLAGSLCACPMASGARQASRRGPAAIPVRDDGHMEPRGLWHLLCWVR